MNPTTTTITSSNATEPKVRHYEQPGWFSRNVLNRLVRRLTRAGVSVWGASELRVRGRTSGEWRSVPVNVLTIGTDRYLVAARGTTQWVRNLRAAGGGELRVGRRVEDVTAIELVDGDKQPILRAYLKRWAFEVGAFFDGVDGDSPSDELGRIAPRHPVFRLTPPTQ